DEAIGTFNKILTLHPQNNEARYNLAFAYNQKGLYNEAAATCEKLLEQNPGNTYAHLLLGDTYDKLGKSKEAKEEYDAYKKLILVK
ncbi:MAG: tetratricopeptide repeat protein, partial [Planctomycetota bacterium]